MRVSAMRMVAGALACAAVAGLLVGDMRGATTDTTLAVPARANAHVSLASNGLFVAAVWAATAQSGETDVFAATSRDGGRTFASPVRVNSTPGDVRVNGEQPPRVALAARGGAVTPEMTVVWTTRGSAGTKLLWSASRDGGRTFSVSATVPDTDAPGNRGWEAVAAGPGGRMFTAWLDHRKLASQVQAPAGHQHGDHAQSGVGPQGQTPGSDPGGAAIAQLSQLYVGSLDGSRPPQPVTGGVCYCCKTALAAGADGALHVAWRHVYPGNMRDIAFSVSRDGGRTFAAPVRVSQDQWQINGCPDDGPAMGVAADGRVHLVWPSVVTEQGGPVKALFHAMTADGRQFTARQRIPTEGHAHHPQLSMAPEGALMVLWDESGTGTRRIATAVGRVDAAGRATFARGAALNETGSYPVVASAGTGRWVAMWTAGPPASSTIKVVALPR